MSKSLFIYPKVPGYLSFHHFLSFSNLNSFIVKHLALLFFLLVSFFSFSQTTVNAYAKVTAVTGSSVLTLSNVNISNHTFTVGGNVIVMQMQDNVIGTNTTNAATFGDLSTIANAGKYEIGIIAAVTPTTGAPTSLTLSTALANAYNINANSSVQLISFRDLGANYTTTANISGLAWNGSVGGVVAFYTSGTLTLNHRIIADGLGFRGGAVSANAPGDYTCINSSYTSTNTMLGAKGEGIYLATVTSYSNGRGKILNGGGGGAENNSGGGGGGNFTAGGGGGLGYPCTTSNSGYGLGGISLSGQISASRIFMGGGGGGGQENNSVGSNGGNGGGIIFIKANTIATSTTCGSSISVSANGVTASNSGNDGSGGGGAGGSIVIQASTFSVNAACSLTVSANAGNGGNVTNSASHGGGGGGGQGAVIYSSAQPTVNVTTQANNGSPGSDNSGGTLNATGGGGTSNSGIITSSSGPLPIELLFFKAEPQNTRVLLTWSTASEKNNDYFTVERSNNGLDYTAVATVNGAGTTNLTNSYQAYDNQPFPGISYYRLRQNDFDGAYKYSPLVTLNFQEAILFSFFPNPVKSGETISFTLSKNSWVKQFDVSISDLTGKEMYSETILTGDESKTEFTLKNITIYEGVYLLKIQGAYSSQIKKLVVQ
jgi:hypothetical protein